MDTRQVNILKSQTHQVKLTPESTQTQNDTTSGRSPLESICGDLGTAHNRSLKQLLLVTWLSWVTQAFSALAETRPGGSGVRGEALFHSQWGSLDRGAGGQEEMVVLSPGVLRGKTEAAQLRPNPRGQSCGGCTTGSGGTGPLPLGCTP